MVQNINNYDYVEKMYPAKRSFKGDNQPAINTEEETPIKILTPADKFVLRTGEEKGKKSNKKALGVGGAVVAIAGSAMLLNPKNASKLLEKLKVMSKKNKIRLQNGKQNIMKTKFYQALDKSYGFASRAIESTGNINNAKDIFYKKLCSQKKSYDFVKNDTIKKGFVKIDDVFTNFMTKINNKITSTFDSLSQGTVRNNYKKAGKQIDNLNTKITDIKSKLPAEQQKLVNEKLEEIAKNREFFNDANLSGRFKAQEKAMRDADLENEVIKRIFSFFNGFKGNNLRGKLTHFDESLTMWADDILKTPKTQFAQEGQEAVGKLFGGTNGVRGGYDEILDITRVHLDSSDQKVLEDAYKKASKKLTKASKNEYLDYFDKKRDLTLGSAPTDILTPIIGLTAGGIAMAAADSKEERNSRWLSGNFAIVPTIIGVGTSIYLTAKLFSGAQGLLMGFGVGAIFSKIGSVVNKHLFGYDEDAIHEAKLQARQEAREERKAQRQEKQNLSGSQEVKNA